MVPEINQEVALKVLSVVDAGLVSGVGIPEPGKMCVEAAVCYALGLPHGDDPECVSRALRSLKIKLNDSSWSSNAARAKGLRRLAVAQLGSRNHLDDKEFAKRVAEMSIRKMVPLALRAAASIQKNADHKDALLKAASKCEKEGTRQSALDAKDAAYAAATAAAAAAAYADAAAAAAYADAAAAAAYADAAAAAAAYAADDAYAAAYAADDAAAAYADAAADAAAYAADDAKKRARDETLASFAEEVVQILIDMKAPGCEFLALTEAA